MRLNQIQVIGTHNSYHQRAHESLAMLLSKRVPEEAPGLDYGHRPLPEQLSMGIRQIELDCFADPEGGRYAEPRGVKWAAQAGLAPVPNQDPEGKLRRPGFKVMHVQDIDYMSSVLTLVDGLKQVRDWSIQHPKHAPIFILLELKEDAPSPELTPALPFGKRELAALEAEILSVFPRTKLLKPDDVRHGEKSLLEGLRKYGWPKLDAVRGKVMLGMDNEGAVRDLYLKGNPALEGRLLFVSVPPANPAAAWMKENDPVHDFDRIQQLVKEGFLVRTRADADTLEARANDPHRRDQAFASGAQFISTDYPQPNPAFSSYRVRFGNDIVARINPLTGNLALDGSDLETTAFKNTGAASYEKGLAGRWDLTIKDTNNKQFPSWLELSADQGMWQARFVGRWGNARPLPEVAITGAMLHFVSPKGEEGSKTDLVFDGKLTGETLTGTARGPDGISWTWTGRRAPDLRPPARLEWGNPITLFNGRDQAGWHFDNPAKGSSWVVEGGCLVNKSPGSNIATDRSFQDFKLRVEVNCPTNANSGIYLRGRYEVQVEDDSIEEPRSHHMGAIYGFLAPDPEQPRRPGVWQTFDITLIGRYVTVIQNGQTIIGNQEILGITGGAFDSHEELPGPIYLQGDHGGIAYRNIILTPAKRL